MRICVIKATKQILFMSTASTAGTLLKNAVKIGYTADQVEEREVTNQEYDAARAEDPTYIAEQQAATDQQAYEETKLQAIADNLPTWQQVADAIDGVSTIAGMRVVLKKIARIVYLLAKTSTT